MSQQAFVAVLSLWGLAFGIWIGVIAADIPITTTPGLVIRAIIVALTFIGAVIGAISDMRHGRRASEPQPDGGR